MQEPIKVLMINYKMQCAGIESFIMNMYRNIDPNKIKIDFLVHYTERQFYDDEIEKNGGQIYRLSIREDNKFIKYRNDLIRFFKEHPEYKIVHGHMESFGGIYLREAKKAAVPVRIAHSHIAQRNLGIKGIVKNILNKSFKTYSTHLFACSNDSGKFIFGDNEEFTVFNNAIEVENFKFNNSIRNEVRDELDIKDEYVIGHVGRFNTQKNHILLIDIFNEVYKKDKNCILILIGEGDLQDSIKAKVNKLGLNKNVKFLGVRNDVNKLYQAMDLFILPSLFEGLPVSGIEAQAAGLKCIFSDNVTEQTTITENTEYFSREMNLSKWADEILKWKNNYLRNDMSENIRESGYDIKYQAKKLENFYYDVINKKV